MVEFQSTHPVWGATVDDAFKASHTEISIHAPRVGCDGGVRSSPTTRDGFQSTHPVWGATCLSHGGGASGPDFNPRTPCGVRRPWVVKSRSSGGFQSTHPVWGATLRGGRLIPLPGISIHAPRVGCDKYLFHKLSIRVIFQSTHPVWGATWDAGGNIAQD